MTEQERTARLEGILEAWNRVLDQHEYQMREIQRRSTEVSEKLDRLGDQVAQMRGWIIGAAAIMGVCTALNAGLR
jgi:hypothetical protein